jgi:hypothetical protein
MRPTVLLTVPVLASTAFASDYATQLIGYSQGSNPVAGYTIPAAALGEPTRYTGVGTFPQVVSPFNPPWLTSEIVSIGQGGSLTLAFDRPVTNNASNPFGLDLLIFHNAFYLDSSGIATSLVSAGGGIVEVSADLDTWVPVTGALAETHFPSLGYSDLTDPYALDPGAVPSDFRTPVNPAFNPIGMSFAQIVAGYAGSGGGTGIDLAGTGLGSISYIRISNPAGSGVSVEIDGVSIVPAPGAAILLAGAAVLTSGRRRAPR